MKVAKLGLATLEIFGLLFREFLTFGVISYYSIPSILLKLVVYIYFKLILLMFSYIFDNRTTLRHLSY